MVFSWLFLSRKESNKTESGLGLDKKLRVEGEGEMNDAEIEIRLVRESRKDWQYMLLEVDKVSE